MGRGRVAGNVVARAVGVWGVVYIVGACQVKPGTNPKRLTLNPKP